MLRKLKKPEFYFESWKDGNTLVRVFYPDGTSQFIQGNRYYPDGSILIPSPEKKWEDSMTNLWHPDSVYKSEYVTAERID